MKNKTIISLVFILPLIIYFALLLINPKINLEESANAKDDLPEVILFSTPMCGECHKMHPIIDKAKTKYKDKIAFTKVDASQSENLHLARKYFVRLVPTVIYLDKNDNVVLKTEGAMTAEEFDGFVKDLLKE